MTPDIDYLALAPEITLAVTAVVVLMLDLFLPRRQRYWTAIVAVLGVTFAALPLIALAVSEVGERSMLGGSYVVDDFALVLKGLFVVAGYLVLLMSVSYIESDRFYQGEYYFLMVLSILGAVVLASSRDLITLFIAIELVSQPMYLLAGWRKGDLRSNEASLKYYLLGVLASALLLYGMSFVYGLTGELTFAGLGFKVSAVPFHFWAPDTYEGAPTPVTAYLSVSSKAAGFVALLVVLYSAFPEAAGVWGPAVWILAALSMTLANLTALRQTNIVRLLAYSSVAQAGFMLVPFAAAATTEGVRLGEAFAATVTYIVIYAFMNLGAFAVVIAGARKTGTGEIEGWGGLGSYAPGLGLLAAAFFFSLAGIPPLAGWIAKLVMFSAAIGADSAWMVVLAAIAAVNAVIALFYYAKVVKTIWMDPVPATAPDEAVRTAPLAGSLGVALGLSVAVVLAAGFFPSLITFFSDATKALAGG